MAYQLFGSMANRAALVANIRSFCETTLGMTVTASASERLTLTHANLQEYITVLTTDSGVDAEIYHYHHPSLAGTAPDDYDDKGFFAVTNLLSEGPYLALHCFGSSSAPFHCFFVLQISPEKYRHFGFGEMDKVGAWTGGTYTYCTFVKQGNDANNFAARDHSYPFSTGTSVSAEGGGSIRLTSSDAASHGIANVSPTAAPWKQDTDKVSAGCGAYETSSHGSVYGFSGWITGQIHTNPAPYNGNTLIAAATFLGTVLGGYRPLGKVPGIAWSSIAGRVGGDEVTLAPDTWKLFPVTRQATPGGQVEGSYNFAIAYKK